MRKIKKMRNKAATHRVYIRKLVDQIIEEILAEEGRVGADADLTQTADFH
jgi:hypothetical protein